MDKTDELDLTKETVEQLKRRIAEGLAASAEHLRYAALAWRELDRRGFALEKFKRGLARYLPDIADGRLLAEAVIAFAGTPALLTSMRGMPAKEQLRLARGEKVQVVTRAGREQAMEIAAVPHETLRHVLRNGEIQAPDVQRMARREAESKPKYDAANDRRYIITVDRKSRMVKVGHMRLPIAEVVSALAISAGPLANLDDEFGNHVETATCKLTREEKERLKAACKAFKVSEPELVRRAVLMLLA